MVEQCYKNNNIEVKGMLLNEENLLRKSIIMANELDVAGEFIYSAIIKLDKMQHFEQVADYFYFLYHLAVGIERVQKILLFIVNDVQETELKEFLVKLKSHNHKSLHDKIMKKVNISLSKEQMELLMLLSNFYKDERYRRFDFLSYEFDDKKILLDFICDNCNNLKFDYSQGKKILLNTIGIKEHLGRVIGRLCHKYYEAIKLESEKRNIYAYELRYGSPAEKLFCEKGRNNSYQNKVEKEKRAIKELLLYIRNSNEDNELINYMNEIDPLPLDNSLIQDYIADLCCGNVSINLLGEIDFLYKEFVNNSYEREQKLSLIGDKGVIFTYESCL